MLTDEEEEALLKAEYNMPLKTEEERKHLLSAIEKLKEEEK